VLSIGRGGRTLGQPTKHVRTHTHKLKPLNHFTVVPQPLSPLRFSTTTAAGCQTASRDAVPGGTAPPVAAGGSDEASATPQPAPDGHRHRAPRPVVRGAAVAEWSEASYVCHAAEPPPPPERAATRSPSVAAAARLSRIASAAAATSSAIDHCAARCAVPQRVDDPHAATVASLGGGWCWEPPAGTEWTRTAGGKRQSGRHGRHGPSGGPLPPPGQLSGARTPGPSSDGFQGAAGRGGYVARARHRVATPGAATSGAGRQPRSPWSVLIASGDFSRIVLSCTGWSVAGPLCASLFLCLGT